MWRGLQGVQGSSQRHGLGELGRNGGGVRTKETTGLALAQALANSTRCDVTGREVCTPHGFQRPFIQCIYSPTASPSPYAHLVAIMLKIWKQAWRKRGEETTPPPRHGSDQEAQLCGADSEGTCSPSIDVVPPMVDNASGAVLSAAGRKRGLSTQSSASETEVPSKQPKAIHGPVPGQPRASHDRPFRPSEVVVLYEPPSKLTFTTLYKHLRQVDKEEIYSRHHFSAALQVLLDMGSCASDLVWRRALSDLDVSVSVAYNEDEEHAKEYVALFEIREIIKNWEYTMPNLDPSSRGLNVTPKFLKLVQVLQSCSPHEDSFRGIVFGEHIHLLLKSGLDPTQPTKVRRRAIALVMAELLRLLDITGLRPQVLIGKDIHTDFPSQVCARYYFLCKYYFS